MTASSSTDEGRVSLGDDEQSFLSYCLGPEAFYPVVAAAANLPREAWQDFGNGVRMARLARKGKTQFILYSIEDDASPDAFMEHMHPGGEFYGIAMGEIEDESGRYGPGTMLWMPPGTKHTPRAHGRTLIFVVWPLGVVLTKKD